MHRILSVILLLFIAAGAMYGGYHLVSCHDGSSIGLSRKILSRSPFDTFLVPGIILFVFNGLVPLVVVIAILLNWRKSPEMICLQGVILAVWMMMQIYYLGAVSYWQLIIGVIALSLVLLGIAQIKKRRHKYAAKKKVTE